MTYIMGKQSIYLNDKFEDEVRNIASQEGSSISDVIRRRVEWSFTFERKEAHLQKLEEKIEAIYALLSKLAGGLGYLVGATKESTKSYEKIRLEGTAYEEEMKLLLSLLRKNFAEEEEGL